MLNMKERAADNCCRIFRFLHKRYGLALALVGVEWFPARRLLFLHQSEAIMTESQR
jgi:hypothetical protein